MTESRSYPDPNTRYKPRFFITKIKIYKWKIFVIKNRHILYSMSSWKESDTRFSSSGFDSFSYFSYMLLGCSTHLQNAFFQNVHLKVWAGRYSYSSFITGVVDTCDGQIAGAVVTGDKLSPISLLPPSAINNSVLYRPTNLNNFNLVKISHGSAC
jgi:hypothetical protein